MTSSERKVTVRWTGRGQVYDGRWRDGSSVLLDSASAEGPSPTEALLLSLATCMAVDIKVILEKGRVPVEGLTVDVTGERASTPPRRFTSIRMEIRVAGPSADDQAKIDRAVRLSRETYCSVFQTLRQDLDVEIVGTRG
jgi:putative redox protein